MRKTDEKRAVHRGPRTFLVRHRPFSRHASAKCSEITHLPRSMETANINLPGKFFRFDDFGRLI
jgi:hypothetical protein